MILFFLGFFCGGFLVAVAVQILALRVNLRDKARMIEVNERSLDALEERNEIGREIVAAIEKLKEVKG